MEGIKHEVSIIKLDIKKIFIELEKINTVISYSEQVRNHEHLAAR